MGKDQKVSNSKKNKIQNERFSKQVKWFYFSGGITFITSFVVYIITLAPSVTFEDSGELITAARDLGVPHEPGYPLFTILGYFFSWLPFGNIAFRLNLMSAFFSSFAALITCYSTILIIEDTFSHDGKVKAFNSVNLQIKYLIAILTGLFFAFSFENWEQSIITEVYGLHGFFVSLFILLIIQLKRSRSLHLRRKYIYLISFFTGLALTNHTTALLFIPIFIFFVVLVDFKLLLDWKLVLKSLLFGLTGLIPLIYLPIASSFNPVLDWGNPENLTNFIRVVSRHQYTELAQSADKFSSGIYYFLTNLLIQQWFPLLLLLLIPAFIALFRYNRKFFWFALIFMFFYFPVTTYLTDFDIRGEGYSADLNRLLVTVFYIPVYLLISILFGIGMYYLVNLLKKQIAGYIVIGLSTILLLMTSISNFRQVDMHDFQYPEHYLHNLYNLADKDALVFTQIDFFYFPTMYYQFVQNKRRDVVMLDQPLLKRSWYIEMLNNNYPEVIENSKDAVNDFLKAVAPFENKEPYNGNYIEQKYIGMINDIIDKALISGKQVYFTYVPPKNFLRNYTFEPVLGAYRLTPKLSVSKLNYDDFIFSDFKKVTDKDPFIVRSFSEFYGEQHIARGAMLEQMGDKADALKFYKLALQFHYDNKKKADYAKSRIRLLEQQNAIDDEKRP